MTTTAATKVDPIVGYVSSDGQTITDWNGKHLGNVRSATRISLPRWSYIHGSHMVAYSVELADGVMCYGRSSRGLAIGLRPYRDQSKRR